MEKIFKELGFSDKDIDAIIKLNPSLEEYDQKNIKDNINILKDIGCSDLYIKNIIVNNTYFLNNKKNDTLSLIKYLKDELGFVELDLLFDSNAYLLNIEKKYLKEFVDEKMQEGKKLEEIRDLIELNLFIVSGDN